jgi:hypothetical protein
VERPSSRLVSGLVPEPFGSRPCAAVEQAVDWAGLGLAGWLACTAGWWMVAEGEGGWSNAGPVLAAAGRA